MTQPRSHTNEENELEFERVIGTAGDWRAHAGFMNALEADGFVLLGGPLEGTAEVPLIVRATSNNEAA